MPQLNLFLRLMQHWISSIHLYTNLWSGVQLRYCKSSQFLRLERALGDHPIHSPSHQGQLEQVAWSYVTAVQDLHICTCTLGACHGLCQGLWGAGELLQKVLETEPGSTSLWLFRTETGSGHHFLPNAALEAWNLHRSCSRTCQKGSWPLLNKSSKHPLIRNSCQIPAQSF